SKQMMEKSKLKSSISNNSLKLEELIKENEDLNKEIKFLENKNRKLRIKIDQMNQVIKTLEMQKSQLEKSERKLKELRLQKDETLSMVAHDIKNPASTIKNFVELLESYDLSAQEQHDVLTGLIETSSRLVRLADEFTQVISEEYTPFNLEKEKIDLRKPIENIVKVNRVKANSKNIELRLYQPDTELITNIDEEKIKEVLDNLIGNAIKFCPEKSKVDVLSQINGTSIIVEVKDNGFGLTETEISHAFEKGAKLSTKPTGNETSSGLGLWIAKKIVEAHNGKVWVKSKKGFGSTFAFSLPVN
ncbi:MAG: hypothetical protein KDC88_06975, partial [Ignavibacteriae bacterium]|nr:hypothetical protein [Ignavibacteriota bacterium]